MFRYFLDQGNQKRGVRIFHNRPESSVCLNVLESHGLL